MEKINDLIYEIDGVRYVLIDVPITNGMKGEVNAAVQKVGGIYQGIKEIKQAGWFTSGYAITRFFIPENRVKEFSQKGI